MTRAPAASTRACAARVVQQHQREQAQPFGVVGIERAQHAAEADRFGTELAPDQRVACRGRVAFVEDQVDDRQHRGPALRQRGVGRHLVGDAGILDLALGAHQPLRHGRLRNEKRARDLAGRKPAEGAQGQRDLGLAVQARDDSR